LGAAVAGTTATIKGLILQDGYGWQLAGGVLNNGALTLDHAVVKNNSVATNAQDWWQGGGGVYVGSGGALTVPAGSFPQTLLTEETAPKLDPGVAERKYYVAGLGDVKEQTVSGNHEQIQLVSVTH
jgi:hypothetical protein